MSDTPKKLWLVVAHAGEYEESRSWSVVAYPDPALANAHANAATIWARRWFERHRNDHEKVNWDDPKSVMPRPKSPFDAILAREDTDDVAYGVRSINVRTVVPKARIGR